MAPAGNFASLMAAINAGAKSVYFGVGNLNMRSGSANFKFEDLDTIVEICKVHKVLSYLTLNTVVYDEEFDQIKILCDEAKSLGVSAIIASDFAVIDYANSINLEVHLSTQCNVSNLSAVKFYSKFADVIVLARELTLEQIKSICTQIQIQKIKGPSGNLVKIEVFIHGALCIANSGKCYMSLSQYNSSANRGKCLQACRRSYRVIDDETCDELIIDNKFVMSPSDLCTIEILDKILDAGVLVLKIEGRGRSPEYVETVVRVYSNAIKLIHNNNYTEDIKKSFVDELKTVFNRGFWQGGYYLGAKIGEWSEIYGSKTTKKKKSVGIVTNYYSKNSVVEFNITANTYIELGNELLIIGPTTGVVRLKIINMLVNDCESKSAKKGDIITVKVSTKVRKNDEVFVIEDES